MKTCTKCGKPVKPPFSLCYDCHQKQEEQRRWREYRDMTPQEREDELEAYYSNECVMCGKEGASVRKDGKCYCGHCWTVWNS